MIKSHIPYYFYHECKECGVCDDPMIHWSGPHIKLVCSNCNKYIKFIGPKSLPQLKDLKQKIYQLCNRDLQKVEALKTEMKFKKKQPGLHEFQEYWKLYLFSRSK